MSFLSLACAVCGANPEQSNEAYLSMTGVMSLTPFFGLVALGIFIVRRAHAIDLATPPVEPEGAPEPRKI
jgi:hypothetical protein